ncbi:MAG: hypothetical protein FDW93_00695 [Bergeyella sp.]|nr:hypothetical protein [Bergeyella sp.]
MTVRNEVPYAKIHNEGFRGVVSISSHTRNRYAKTRFLTETPTSKGNLRRKTLTGKSGESFVKAHKRRLNMPRRQFIPTTQSPSPVLMEALKRKLTRDLKKIITL